MYLNTKKAKPIRTTTLRAQGTQTKAPTTGTKQETNIDFFPLLSYYVLTTRQSIRYKTQ